MANTRVRKKRNPNDLTLRNLRAVRKDLRMVQSKVRLLFKLLNLK